MSNIAPRIMAVLLTLMLVSACTSAEEEPPPPDATQIAAIIFGTQTASAPTVTNTATATSTATPPPTETPAPVPTSTPTGTSTPTLVPTNTPTVTPTPEPDYSAARLTTADLPPGFAQLPTEIFMPEWSELFENAYIYQQLQPYHFLMGLTTVLKTSVEQGVFDSQIRDPEFFALSVLSGMGFGSGESAAIGVEPVPQAEDIGDSSVGIEMTVPIEGVPMRMEFAAFRIGEVSQTIVYMHEGGIEPELNIIELARLLQTRTVAALPSAERQTGDLLDKILAEGVITVATDADYPPQSQLDPFGKVIGFDVDVAAEIASRLGVEIEYVTPDWELITAGDWGGSWDMNVGSMTVTKARSERLLFSSAYYFTPARYAVRSDAGIQTVDDIAGQTVCAGANTSYEAYLMGQLDSWGIPDQHILIPPPDAVQVGSPPDNEQCLDALASGESVYDIVLTSYARVEAALASAPGLESIGTPFVEHIAAAFDRSSSLDSTSLRDRVSRIITGMHADGTLRELSIRYFKTDLTHQGDIGE